MSSQPSTLNYQLFQKHFDTLAETPDAVAKLRAFVLDLAVRGRLVPQNPKDTPAIQLVERAKAVLAKNRKKSDDQNNGKPEVPPFSLPMNWCWTCLDELGDTAPKNELDDKIEVGFSPMRLVNAKFGEPISFERKTWSEVRKGFTHFADGDVVVAKITPCFQNGKSGVIRGAPNGLGAGTTELHVLRPVADCVLPDYALIFVKSPHFLINGEAHMTGTAGQKRVSWDYFARTPFSLPPLAEQRRIVAKVEELLALCDELEARQTAAREHRARLVRSALDHLTTAPAEPEFRQHAAFVLQHSDLVLDSVITLRQAIYSLAVQGHIVPQNPNDEPVTKHLSAIERAKAQFVSKGMIRRVVEFPEVGPDAAPYKVPGNWKWVRVGVIGMTQTGSTPPTAENEFFGDFIPFVKPADLTDREINYAGDGLSKSGIEKSTLIPANSILMVCIGGSIGKTNLNTREVCCNQQINALTPFTNTDSRYIMVCMKSSWFQDKVKGDAGQTTLPIISKGKWEQLPFPLPPLAEQQRIVVKVDELMRWCDALETRLTAAQTTATALLDATLHQILTA